MCKDLRRNTGDHAPSLAWKTSQAADHSRKGGVQIFWLEMGPIYSWVTTAETVNLPIFLGSCGFEELKAISSQGRFSGCFEFSTYFSAHI